MKKQEYIELINKEIDGIITPSEKNNLHNFLKNNTEANQYYNEIIQAVGLLDEITEKDPSPELKKYIMNSIDAGRYQKKENSRAFSNYFLGKLQPRAAYAMAAAAVIFIFSLIIFNETEISDNSKFFGSIGINGETLEELKSEDIGLNTLKGSVELKGNNNFLVLKFNLRSKYENNLLVSFNPAELKFENSTEKSENIDQIGSSVQINFKDRYSEILVFRKIQEPMRDILVEVSQSGNILYRKNF